MVIQWIYFRYLIRLLWKLWNEVYGFLKCYIQISPITLASSKTFDVNSVNSVDEKNKLLLGPKLANDCYRTLKSQIFLPSDKILSETNWNLLTTSLWLSFQYRIAKITFQEYSFKFRFHKFRKVYLHASWNFYRTNLLILIVIN